MKLLDRKLMKKLYNRCKPREPSATCSLAVLMALGCLVSGCASELKQDYRSLAAWGLGRFELKYRSRFE